ncbi:Juvenile hormone epoxide hydrolase [Eumeta japonica]|uniref:Juvenile hormone epoxide hydrolase n=1 Tax=Eumeta variegata TaxID=151549 RepID=A0A4C1V0M8_EUMVA|nr:Juvenile hormone epoxide hydrolase [Eumeta japonica]
MVNKVLVVVSLGVGFIVWRYWCQCSQPLKPPTLDLNEWWGPEHLKTTQDESIKPFKINFKPDMIKDLKDRLSRARKWTPPLEGVGFEYGFNSQYLEKVLQYWKDNYKFEAREQFLNKYPHFTTFIQGLNIHFIRVKPEVTQGVEVIPLLLLHGWPGSVREFYEIIPMLTEKRPDRNFVFEVVVPSLPGYGFSDGAVRPGLATPHIGVIMRNLMHRLGHKKFYVQGGDWGSITVSNMATLFPQEILGHHTNCPFVQQKSVMLKTLVGSIFPSLVVEQKYADRMYPLSKFYSFMIEESGYLHIQATKPDTVGVALTDSPAGLAAYILEKFSTWTVPEHKRLPDGGLTKKYTLDQLIDNLMIYWTSSSITTSMRLYSEDFSSKRRAMELDDVDIEAITSSACMASDGPAAGVLAPSLICSDAFILLHLQQYYNIFMGAVPAKHFDCVKLSPEWRRDNSIQVSAARYLDEMPVFGQLCLCENLHSLQLQPSRDVCSAYLSSVARRPGDGGDFLELIL